jgi:hypothetical protein
MRDQVQSTCLWRPIKQGIASARVLVRDAIFREIRSIKLHEARLVLGCVPTLCLSHNTSAGNGEWRR